MKLVAVGLLLGVLCVQHLAVLPAAGWAWTLVLLVPASIAFPSARLVLAAGCGFLWALAQAHAQLQPALSSELIGEDIAVAGVIVSLPQARGRATRFELDIQRLIAPQSQSLPLRVRLNWYGERPALRLGQRWRLTVRLEPPRGFMNPGGFDYEGWLFRHGIRATGYVRDGESAVRLAERALDVPIGRLRQAIAGRIRAGLGDSAEQGVIAALAIGERGGIVPQQWRLLLATGTNHLVAISGLHIGLIAGLTYWLALRAWRLSARLCRRLAAPRAGALAGLAAGLAYALLAGFSVPTQRALVMLAVVMGAVSIGRSLRAGHTLAVALTAVLVWDTLAVLAPGFWLSFSAVAVIAYMLGQRRLQPRRWWHWGRLQVVLALALAPLTIVFFQQAALIAPLANLLAVPWVGMVVVPLTLLATVAMPVSSLLSNVLLGLAAGCVQLWLWALQALAALPYAQWHHGAPAWTLLPGIIGLALVLAPRGWPARWLGAIALAPLALAAPAHPQPGVYRLTLLDVGQGLAAVVQTREHVLVYDTGARFSAWFNAGDAVVVPYLRQRGLTRVDTLVVSHGDNDHIGGAAALLDALPVARVLTSEPRRLEHPSLNACVAGQSWTWDGVRFEMLHPSGARRAFRENNNRSCVLRVSNAAGAVLLTGDIEAPAETRLVDIGAPLRSDVVVVPHHGSRSSSTRAFVATTDPALALLPVGYRNRYGFPAPAVVARYRAHDSVVLSTACSGAIELAVQPGNGIVVDPGYRQRARRYWTAGGNRSKAPNRVSCADLAEPDAHRSWSLFTATAQPLP